ncbi:MAG: YtxH domain-containing protein [Gemmatimonadaceae bacterium]
MAKYEFGDDEPFVVIEKQSAGVGSFLFGAAIGAGLALLFAPRSGAETRLELQRGARRVRDRAEDLVEDATDRVADSYQSARDRVEERLQSARLAVDVKRHQVSRAMAAGREAAQQAREDLERRIAETKAAYQAGIDVARSGNAGAAGAGVGTEGGSTADGRDQSPLDTAAAGDDPAAASQRGA